jgi:diaminohydroxyphosphoribosylaminopyrimidine deaminase/5-amino-6-(5-phosphoribosylamino)uracil reductase
MFAALALGRRGVGECWPNPSVGCVIVSEGRVVGRGRTGVGGRPHAETEALAMAGEAARGATVYVTLEPCSHVGQTPACSAALIAAGVAEVVVALGDPDPRVDGRGVAALRAAGVAVSVGTGAVEAGRLHAGFFSRVRRGRPVVTLKLATTLDGRIATRAGESQWITGEAARLAGQALRARHDAVLVGVGTVLADDPLLTCRMAGARVRPVVRVVADSHLRTPLTSRVVATAGETPSWFLARGSAEAERVRAFKGAGAVVIACEPGGVGVEMADALGRLGAAGITCVLAEGGGHVAAALLRDDLVDEVAWFHAPCVMGGDGLASVQGFGVELLAQMRRFAPVARRDCGGDGFTLLRREAG